MQGCEFAVFGGYSASMRSVASMRSSASMYREVTCISIGIKLTVMSLFRDSKFLEEKTKGVVYTLCRFYRGYG